MSAVGYDRLDLPAVDLLSLAWLCEMASLGCLHTNRSAWASQLRLDAAALRARADCARQANAE